MAIRCLGGLARLGLRLGKAGVAGSNPARGSMLLNATSAFLFRKSQIHDSLILSAGVVLSSEKRFTSEELKEYDGKDGRPAYIAYKGKVYDVSDDFLWVEGDHQGEHVAGKDLTEEMMQAPHAEDVLERVPLIGVLVK